MQYINSQNINLLNVDVEGFDLQVLSSNDWNIYRPEVIAVETWTKDIDYDKTLENSIYSFLRKQNYGAFSNTMHTWFL
ncbi:MAG: FkbM family methyltransferase [Janthinobacterium lividum]